MDVKGQLTAASPSLSALGPAPRRPWRPFLPRQPEPEWMPHRWTPRRCPSTGLGGGVGVGVESVNFCLRELLAPWALQRAGTEPAPGSVVCDELVAPSVGRGSHP